MTIKHIIFAIACTGTAAHAMAGPALDAAQAHFTAIGAADRAAEAGGQRWARGR